MQPKIKKAITNNINPASLIKRNNLKLTQNTIPDIEWMYAVDEQGEEHEDNSYFYRLYKQLPDDSIFVDVILTYIVLHITTEIRDESTGERKISNMNIYIREEDIPDKVRFIKDVKTALLDEFKTYEAEKIHDAVYASDITDALVPSSTIDRLSTRTVQFFTGARSYNAKNNGIILDRFFKDTDGLIYYKKNENEYERLDINEARTALYVDPKSDFWYKFFEEWKPKIDMWIESILTEVIRYQDDRKVGSKRSLEEELLETTEVPAVFLQTLALKLNVATSGKGKKYVSWVESVRLAVNNSVVKKSTFTPDNIIDALTEALLRNIVINKSVVLDRYTNDEVKPALSYIKQYYPSGKEPAMPDTWKMFLGGSRFTDSVMELARIAFAIHSAIDCGYCGRQSLVLLGEGQDGKGVFLNVIDKALNMNASAQISINTSPKNFNDDDRFGLAPIIGKKFVYFSDCKQVTALFKTDKFKALTGGDDLDIEQKFKAPIRYVPMGVFVAISTNNPIWISGDHGRTRLLPVLFKKNYTSKTFIKRNDLVKRLLQEREEFFQWCEDYLFELNKKAHGRLIHDDNMLICTDEDFVNQVCDEKVEIDEEELFCKAIERITLYGQCAITYNKFQSDNIDSQEMLIRLISECLESSEAETLFNTHVDADNKSAAVVNKLDFISWLYSLQDFNTKIYNISDSKDFKVKATSPILKNALVSICNGEQIGMYKWKFKERYHSKKILNNKVLSNSIIMTKAAEDIDYV